MNWLPPLLRWLLGVQKSKQRESNNYYQSDRSISFSYCIVVSGWVCSITVKNWRLISGWVYVTIFTPACNWLVLFFPRTVPTAMSPVPLVQHEMRSALAWSCCLLLYISALAVCTSVSSSKSFISCLWCVLCVKDGSTVLYWHYHSICQFSLCACCVSIDALYIG